MSDLRDEVVSVVMPTHNRADRLTWALASVLERDHPSIEVIVVDDGSKDHTRSVLASVDDPRLRVVHLDPNGGVSKARNAGIAAATGRWVAFVDDDDYWLPTKLSAQLAELRSSGARWSIVAALEVTPALEPLALARTYDAMDVEWLLGSNVVPGGCSGVVVERALLDTIGGFDPALSMFADWELWTRCAIEAGRPAVLPEPLVLYVVHPGQMSADQTKSRRELLVIRDRFRSLRRQRRGGDGGRFPMVEWVVRRARRGGGLGPGARAAWQLHDLVPRAMVASIVTILLAPNWARRVRSHRQTQRLREDPMVVAALAGVRPQSSEVMV
ncbi:MAG: glycosyltransferase family A protein [Acidimicrobiales bacterium]